MITQFASDSSHSSSLRLHPVSSRIHGGRSYSIGRPCSGAELRKTRPLRNSAVISNNLKPRNKLYRDPELRSRLSLPLVIELTDMRNWRRTF